MGKEIVKDVYCFSSSFPKDETYGLTYQLRRAAISIPSNIAEGFNRYQNKEYKRFLYISLGSCAELETQVEISFDLGFISEDKMKIILNKISFESKMLTNLIKKLDEVLLTTIN